MLVKISTNLCKVCANCGIKVNYTIPKTSILHNCTSHLYIIIYYFTGFNIESYFNGGGGNRTRIQEL